MKKLCMIALAIAMVFTMTACGQGQNNMTTTTTTTTTTASESKDGTATTTTETTSSMSGSSSTETTTESPSQTSSQSVSQTTTSASDSSATTTTDASNADQTIGQTLLGFFKEIMQQEKAHTAMDIANDMLTNKIIEFEGSADEIQPGFLPGFDVDIEGFSKGAVFAPIIGSIPFVGYVFQLEPGADVQAFVKNLQDHANPNWLVCVAADETVVEAVGNTVLFIMCRSTNK